MQVQPAKIRPTLDFNKDNSIQYVMDRRKMKKEASRVNCTPSMSHLKPPAFIKCILTASRVLALIKLILNAKLHEK